MDGSPLHRNNAGPLDAVQGASAAIHPALKPEEWKTLFSRDGMERVGFIKIATDAVAVVFDQDTIALVQDRRAPAAGRLTLDGLGATP